jgi:hypothetical protein
MAGWGSGDDAVFLGLRRQDQASPRRPPRAAAAAPADRAARPPLPLRAAVAGTSERAAAAAAVRARAGRHGHGRLQPADGLLNDQV